MYNFRRANLNHTLLAGGICLLIAGTMPPARAQSSGGLLSRIAGGSGKGKATPAKAEPAAKPNSKPAEKTASGDKGVVKAAAKAEGAVVEATKKPEIPVVSSEGYTGLLIDARDLDIQRTPACVIYGPEPDGETLYPDAQHVPTPDEVQDASVVRYYFDEASAKKGNVVGSNPLILKAVAAVGPGHDCLRLSPEDTARLKALEKEIHLTLSWRVGVLLPQGR